MFSAHQNQRYRLGLDSKTTISVRDNPREGNASSRYSRQRSSASVVWNGYCNPNSQYPHSPDPDKSIAKSRSIGALDEPAYVRRRRLEAVLFVSREPISVRKLMQLAALTDATEARTLCRELNDLYDRKGSGLRIEFVAGGYQIFTRAGLAKWTQRLDHVHSVERLTEPALETLALVAYRQPIMRAEIDAIRGVNSGELLRQLIEKDLVRICGRSEDLGRPYLYGTTRGFLRAYGLPSLRQLPRLDWINSYNSASNSVASE